jgi:type IVB pilus formation R64 PilN family outer membrane protein
MTTLRSLLVAPGLGFAHAVAGALGGLALAGCTTPSVTERVQADHAAGAAGVAPLGAAPALPAQAGARVAGAPIDAARRATEQAARPVLRRSAAPWIGSVSVPMGSGERLPSIFTEPVRLNFEDAASGGKVSLRTVADRITAVTGVAVRLKPDVFAGAEGVARAPIAPIAPSPGPALPVASVVPLPGLTGPGAPPAGTPAAMPMPVAAAAPVTRETSVNAVAMRWAGTLEGYLDLIADQLGLAWEFRDGAVVIERFRTEFFEVASLDSETDYHLGLSGADPALSAGASGGGGGGSASGAGNDVTEHGKANAVASILAAVTQMIRDVPGSSAVRSEGSGRIAVTTTKETLSKVRDFIRAENESLLRQAQIQFDIYSVTRNESDERGIEWSAVLTALGNVYSGTIGSPATLTGSSAAGIGFTILTPTQSGVTDAVTQHLGGSNALIKLLNEYGTSTQHREVSLLALNRTWDRKSSLGGRAYVSATVPGAATTAGVGAPGLVTSTVTTGDRYLAQPFILDNNTVLLKFGIGLSSLVNLANFTSGTGIAQQTVQTPETTAVNDQATVALKAGQVLVITGLSRAVAGDDRRALSEDASIGLGGSRTQTRLREDFVIFVRPTLL